MNCGVNRRGGRLRLPRRCAPRNDVRGGLVADLEEAFELGAVVDFESFGFDVSDEVGACCDADFSFGGDIAVHASFDFQVLDA